MIRLLVKPANALISGYSFLKSSVTGVTAVYGMPVSIGVELTNYCNLNCPECLSGSDMMVRERGFMKTDLFDKIINELKPYIFNLNLFFQGEPMLHPQFFLFLNKSLNINTTVSTNGHFLTEENSEKLVSSGLKRLVVSLDGMDQNTYSTYRVNGDLNKVLRGIKNVSEALKKKSSSMKLIIQFLVNRNNEHQIPAVKHFVHEMKASLKLKSMQIINNESFETWLPSLKKFRRYKLQNNQYIIKNPLPDRCARLWFNPLITWDGKVLPCCFDKDAQHVMGNINDDSFREIWDGPKYRIFRKRLFSGRDTIGICGNCTSGLRGVKY